MSGVVAENRRHGVTVAIRRSLTIDLCVSAWLAVTVIVFAGGSSSVLSVTDVARPARWPVLFVLDALALLLARDRLRRLTLRPVEIAATSFALLCVLSAAWSIAPRLSVERGVSLAAIAFAAGALAVAARGRPDRAGRMITGLAAGAGFVAILGWVMLAFGSSVAAQVAGSNTPWRFQGFGENPNTVALLAAVAAPLVAWLLRTAVRPAGRVCWAAVLLAFAVTIALSGSRGAVLAAAAGLLILCTRLSAPARTRVAAAGAVVLASVGLVVISQIPQPLPAQTTVAPPAAGGAKGNGKPVQPPPPPPPPPPPATPATSSTSGSRLSDELQPAQSTRRRLFGTSGRVQAWEWALGEARKRPITGYGFGTEDHVFIDRLYSFFGDRPENSFIGTAMQLGLAGLVALCALVVLAAVAAYGAIRRLGRSPAAGLAAACAGTAFAGLAIALVQSYLYSAGNLATLTVWVCAFLAADAAGTWEGAA